MCRYCIAIDICFLCVFVVSCFQRMLISATDEKNNIVSQPGQDYARLVADYQLPLTAADEIYTRAVKGSLHGLEARMQIERFGGVCASDLRKQG